jgi:hypothetical protein
VIAIIARDIAMDFLIFAIWTMTKLRQKNLRARQRFLDESED